ncbi:MAG: nitroreductase family protein [Trueperaceae bacterium]
MVTEKPINPVERKVLDVVAKRWSPRGYSSKAVESEKLATVFEAARWTASSYNEQPWRFIVASKENAEAYNKLLSVAIEFNQSWAKAAPVLILIVGKKTFSEGSPAGGKPNNHAWYDAGAAATALSLEAAHHDLYVHQMAGIVADKARELYNIPDDYEAMTLLTLGYVGDLNDLPEHLRKMETQPRQRKPLAELVFENEFGKSAKLA